MWQRRKLDPDKVARMHETAVQNDAHDAGASGLLARIVRHSPQMLLEAGAEPVDLDAGSAQASDLDDGVRSQMQQRGRGQREEVDSLREDVLTELAGTYGKALRGEFGEQFGCQQVDLAAVGLVGVFAAIVEVLDCGATVRVAFHTFARDEAQRRLHLLREAMPGATGGGEDDH